jgi:hypothetical protein
LDARGTARSLMALDQFHNRNDRERQKAMSPTVGDRVAGNARIEAEWPGRPGGRSPDGNRAC